MARCYAPVIALLMWAASWQAGLNDPVVVAPWLAVVAVAVVLHIGEGKRAGRWHVHR